MLQWKTWEVRVYMPSEAQMVLLQTAEAGHGGAGFSIHYVELQSCFSLMFPCSPLVPLFCILEFLSSHFNSMEAHS